MSRQCPETELLLCCARTCPDGDQADRIAALASNGLDWGGLLRLARRHGVLPLLHRHLSAVCPHAIPDNIRNNMDNYWYACTRRNLYLTAELLSVLNLFETNGVVAIPYKGPVLAASVYGDLTLRPFDDLDILVRESDLPIAKQLLVSQGYRLHALLTPAQERRYVRSQCEHRFVRGDGKVQMELQWAIAPRCYGPGPDVESLWKRRIAVPLADSKVLSLSPEDLLLILCHHGFKHFWEQLKWICDVAELIRTYPNMDWEYVAHEAVVTGCGRITWLGLRLAHEMLGAELPDLALQQMRDDAQANRLAEWASARLFLDPPRPPGTFEGISFRVRARERLKDRLGWCLRRAFTPTVDDWAAVRLPAFLSALHYPIRPIRLAAKYASGHLQKATAATSRLR